MNIDWIIPCRYLEVHDNLGTLVGAGIDTFWVPDLPAQMQVLMAVRLTALLDELGPEHEHPVRNVVRSPGGDVVDEQTGNFALGGVQENVERENWLHGLLMPMVVTFEATEEGTYTVEHFVDHASYPVPLHIVHGPPPGAQLPE